MTWMIVVQWKNRGLFRVALQNTENTKSKKIHQIYVKFNAFVRISVDLLTSYMDIYKLSHKVMMMLTHHNFISAHS